MHGLEIPAEAETYETVSVVVSEFTDLGWLTGFLEGFGVMFRFDPLEDGKVGISYLRLADGVFCDVYPPDHPLRMTRHEFVDRLKEVGIV